jgi:hypothetical protein
MERYVYKLSVDSRNSLLLLVPLYPTHSICYSYVLTLDADDSGPHHSESTITEPSLLK